MQKSKKFGENDKKKLKKLERMIKNDKIWRKIIKNHMNMKKMLKI